MTEASNNSEVGQGRAKDTAVDANATKSIDMANEHGEQDIPTSGDASSSSPEADDKTEQVSASAEAGTHTSLDPTDVEHADSLRRKRDREGSLEPSLTPSKQEAIPSKKNRLQGDTVPEVPAVSSSSPSRQTVNIEGEKVGHIRKRVEDLSWKQRKEGHRDDGIDEVDEEDEGDEEGSKKAPAGIEESEEKEQKDISQSATSEEPKRSQPTFSSFAASSGFSSSSTKATDSIFGQKQDEKVEEGEPKSTSTDTSAPLSPARKQPTFSSFSKSSSPFGSASASIAGPSWLAGKAGGSSAGGGGIKPSSLGSMPGSSKDRESRSTPPLHASSSNSPSSPPPQATAPGKALGFGAFAANTPFAAKSSNRSSTPTLSATRTDADQAGGEGSSSDNEKSGKSFDEALRERGAAAEERKKVETQLDKGQADLRTGEEDELTVASIRAKLFTMAEDKSWKERGTGTVRCNIPKRRTGDYGGSSAAPAEGGARLVMRSEGVLRLILNVKLFKGMKVNLEQDKFLRLVAFEDGKLNHFAIRMGNASAASQFYDAIQQHIPVHGDSIVGTGDEAA